MAVDLKEKAIALLSSTSSVDMKTVQKNTLYTVPAGKVAYVTHVLIRDPSASMAGGTDYDLGTGANADTWKQTVDLSDATVSGTDSILITASGTTAYSESAAASVFGIKPITGTTSACTATIDVFGILV